MKKGWIVLIVIIVIIAIPVLVCSSSYNKLVAGREAVAARSADIDTQLQRRGDLIPNLVSTVKGYMEHEQGIIDSITESREKLAGAKDLTEKAAANDELSAALSALTVVVENYPDLKANTNFIALQDELAGSENRIATARRDYNAAVGDYNLQIAKFPGLLIARFFNFTAAEYFAADEKSTEVPNVAF